MCSKSVSKVSYTFEHIYKAFKRSPIMNILTLKTWSLGYHTNHLSLIRIKQKNTFPKQCHCVKASKSMYQAQITIVSIFQTLLHSFQLPLSVGTSAQLSVGLASGVFFRFFNFSFLFWFWCFCWFWCFNFLFFGFFDFNFWHCFNFCFFCRHFFA